MPGAGQGPEEMKAVERRSEETPSREGTDRGVGPQSTFKRCCIKGAGLQAAGGQVHQGNHLLTAVAALQ